MIAATELDRMLSDVRLLPATSRSLFLSNSKEFPEGSVRLGDELHFNLAGVRRIGMLTNNFTLMRWASEHMKVAPVDVTETYHYKEVTFRIEQFDPTPVAGDLVPTFKCWDVRTPTFALPLWPLRDLKWHVAPNLPVNNRRTGWTHNHPTMGTLATSALLLNQNNKVVKELLAQLTA